MKIHSSIPKVERNFRYRYEIGKMNFNFFEIYNAIYETEKK